ncbi:hypothetical protein [Clostridium chrysemydis]|uniref:hypothetical protein n=1 Tax=Clostridium chrysemydis TaxID=2665504 RepID=UPI0018838E45|nr:hypothetical protein [Clostridium chrysemydis]
MGKNQKCSVIIKDDFNNVLIIAKGKKNDPIKWQLIGRESKGKETKEKCINNCVKEVLNTLLFDLEEVDEFLIEDQSVYLFKGKLKEYINLGKNVKEIEWVNEESIENYDFLNGEKELLIEYFKL